LSLWGDSSWGFILDNEQRERRRNGGASHLLINAPSPCDFFLEFFVVWSDRNSTFPATMNATAGCSY
jgi:hypothetical protein